MASSASTHWTATKMAAEATAISVFAICASFFNPDKAAVESAMAAVASAMAAVAETTPAIENNSLKLSIQGSSLYFLLLLFRHQQP
ncbi:hypothetical protein ACFX2F_043261 [Malus domestica]